MPSVTSRRVAMSPPCCRVRTINNGTIEWNGRSHLSTACAVAESGVRAGGGSMRFSLRSKLALTAAGGCSPAAALAHHSFAVFFDGQKSITITGVVTEFKFSEPARAHRAPGEEQGRRDGGVEGRDQLPRSCAGAAGHRTALTAGETITIEGEPGRNDRALRSAARARSAPTASRSASRWVPRGLKPDA